MQRSMLNRQTERGIASTVMSLDALRFVRNRKLFCLVVKYDNENFYLIWYFSRLTIRMLYLQVFDIWNRRELSSKTTSTFRCDLVGWEGFDLFSRTRGYSPRNEVYFAATKFVDMWRELMGTEVLPYREFN